MFHGEFKIILPPGHAANKIGNEVERAELHFAVRINTFAGIFGRCPVAGLIFNKGGSNQLVY